MRCAAMRRDRTCVREAEPLVCSRRVLCAGVAFVVCVVLEVCEADDAEQARAVVQSDLLRLSRLQERRVRPTASPLATVRSVCPRPSSPHPRLRRTYACSQPHTAPGCICPDGLRGYTFVTAACCCSCTGTRDTQGVVDEGVLRRTPAYSGALQGPTTAAHRRYLPSFVQSVQVLPGPCPKGCGSSRLELRMCARTPLSLSGTGP